MIVCMSRRICVDLYNAIVKLHPDWHAEEDDKGVIKIVMTGSAADKLEWQPHIADNHQLHRVVGVFESVRQALAAGLVADMWLTGFDAPCLHTMYADKPMQRHGLM